MFMLSLSTIEAAETCLSWRADNACSIIAYFILLPVAIGVTDVIIVSGMGN